MEEQIGLKNKDTIKKTKCRNSFLKFEETEVNLANSVNRGNT